MNYKMVLYTMGRVVLLEAAFLVLPMAVSLLYGERCAVSFGLTILVALAVGFLLTFLCRGSHGTSSIKDGFMIVALTWIMLSAIGALPFVFSREIPSYVDAFFETVSGFTTTGATILTDVEALSRGMIFWRSFTHWIGGMGILVFVVMLMKTTDRSINILKAEMPGPTVDKLAPKSRDTARILYLLYISLTVLETVLLLLGGMGLFDSVVHSLSTAGTGGFGAYNASAANFSPYIQWVLTVFMLLFGVNFNLYYLLLLGRVRDIFRNTEFKVYLGIIAAAVTIITVDILPLYQNFSTSLRQASFQVAAIMSTTGFITADFTVWSPLSKTLLLLLMFLGGCAGSTAGGLKLSRIIILCKMARRELRRTLRPRVVDVIKMDGHRLEEQTAHSVAVYFALYMLCIGALLVALSFSPFDLETNLFSSVSCFNNVGPAFGMAGPVGNYSLYQPVLKLLLCAGMLLGRLEIYPMLLLFVPAAWRKK
ncbi:MAG: TrkH family potassium uptake protein [Clostridiales bacterium]|nr:TrkH family potassium uptake protein [Clostridiales bacterium]